VGCKNFNKLPQLGFLIFFDKIFLVNLINHNLYGVEISAFKKNYKKIWDFFENFSILEVEIGRNGPGILGVKAYLITGHNHSLNKSSELHSLINILKLAQVLP
jgi:hypothetical protein